MQIVVPRLYMNYSKPDSDGKKKVYWQVIINRKKKVFDTGIRWPVYLWDPLRKEIKCETVHQVTKRSLKSKFTNNKDYRKHISVIEESYHHEYVTALTKIEEVKSKLFEIIKNYELRGAELTLKQLVEHYKMKRRVSHNNFFEYCEIEMQKRVRTNEIRTKSSIKSHKTKLKLLKIYANNELHFAEITPEFLKKYNGYLISMGYSENYIIGAHKTLHTYLERAVLDNYIEYNPYKKTRGLTKAYEPGDREVLEVEEFNKMLQYYYSNTAPMTHRVVMRAYFFAVVCGGIDFCDLKELEKEANVIENVLVFTRKKLLSRKRAVKIPLTEFALSLIADSDRDNEGHYQLIRTYKNLQTHNVVLKEICKHLEIDKKVTTKTARHYFGTRTLESGASVNFVSGFMGHADISTTVRYYYKPTTQNLRPALEEMQNSITKKA